MAFAGAVEPPTLGIELYPGLLVSGGVGVSYRIDYALSLPATNWTTLTNFVLQKSPSLFFDYDSVTNHTKRYYRAVATE